MTRPKVLAYYFPNYHLDPMNEARLGAGWTEWDLVRAARPIADGHYQPRVPALGEGDEADPAVMAQSIDLAADHGIDGFIFDYYWYEGRPFLHGALERGFLKAENRDRMEFSLMWANHDWIELFPSASPTDPDPLVYAGGVTRAQFEEFAEYVIEHYFSQPNHTLIDGRPRFSIYEIGNLIRSFGGVEATRDALDWFDERTRAAGFPGLHLDLVVWAFAVLPSEVEIEEPAVLVEAVGALSASSYVWVHHLAHEGAMAPTERSWGEIGEGAFEAYEQYRRDLPVPFHPNVSVGWDSTPRTSQARPFEVGHYPWGTPWEMSLEGFRDGLERAKAFQADRDGYAEVTLNAWNEWTEGSYLLPDERFGTGFLEAIRDVFGVAGRDDDRR